MKTLIESPKLEIDSTRDGVWLHFATLDGRHTSLNIPLSLVKLEPSMTKRCSNGQ